MDIKDIENLALLARIELGDAEKASLLQDLDAILGYVKQIESLDLPVQAGVSKNDEEYKLYNVWREDLPASGGRDILRDFSEQFIKEQFPDSQDGFLKVKKIL